MSTTAPERAAATTPWWPWLLPLAATALVAAGLAQAVVTGPDLTQNVEAVVNLPFAIGFSVVAAAIWASRPTTAGLRRLGALYTVVGLGSSLVLPVQSWWRAAEQVGLPGEAVARWLGEWVWALGAAPLLAVGLLLYPDGRLPGSRWWPAALAGIVAVAGLIGSNAVRGLGVGEERAWAAVGGVAFVLLLASASAGLVALLLRFRRAPRGSELRGQISAFVVVGALVALVAALPDGDTATHLVLTLATGIALPATVANAVVRHGLLDTPAELAARLDAVTASRRALVTEREEERVRLRRELHDGLGPSLAAIGLGLRQLQRDVDATREPVVTLMADEVQRAVVEVRRICEGLRPEALEELGLVPALTGVADRLSAMVDRAEALGGATTLHRGAGRGTVVRLRLPESP